MEAVSKDKPKPDLDGLDRMLVPRGRLPRGAHKERADSLAETARDSLLDAAKGLDGTEHEAHLKCLELLAGIDDLRELLV